MIHFNNFLVNGIVLIVVGIILISFNKNLGKYVSIFYESIKKGRGQFWEKSGLYIKYLGFVFVVAGLVYAALNFI